MKMVKRVKAIKPNRRQYSSPAFLKDSGASMNKGKQRISRIPLKSLPVATNAEVIAAYHMLSRQANSESRKILDRIIKKAFAR